MASEPHGITKYKNHVSRVETRPFARVRPDISSVAIFSLESGMLKIISFPAIIPEPRYVARSCYPIAFPTIAR